MPHSPGVRESQTQINALIDRERKRGIAASRIVLAGFSQGDHAHPHVTNYRVTPPGSSESDPLKGAVLGGGQQQATASVEMINRL